MNGNLFMGLIGLTSTIYGVFRIVSHINIKRNGIEARAKVVKGKNLSTVNNSRRWNRPMFEFKVDGKNFKVVHAKADDDSKYKIGDSLEIKYNKKKPEKFVILSDSGMGVEIFYLAFGILLTFIAIVNI